jgi:hypothetical protein
VLLDNDVVTDGQAQPSSLTSWPWFENRPIRDEYLIVDKGKLAGAGAYSYSAGNATRGSEEAAKFKRG